MQFEEVDMSDAPSFNSAEFKQTSSNPTDVRLMSQFNLASKETSTVSQFLGYYRILEILYSTPNRKSIAQDFMVSVGIAEIFERVFENGHFEDFVSATVHARHRCDLQ